MSQVTLADYMQCLHTVEVGSIMIKARKTLLFGFEIHAVLMCRIKLLLLHEPPHNFEWMPWQHVYQNSACFQPQFWALIGQGGTLRYLHTWLCSWTWPVVTRMKCLDKSPATHPDKGLLCSLKGGLTLWKLGGGVRLEIAHQRLQQSRADQHANGFQLRVGQLMLPR